MCKYMMITSYFLGALNKIESLKIALNSILSFPVAFMFHLSTQTTCGRISPGKNWTVFFFLLFNVHSNSFLLASNFCNSHRKTKNPNFSFLIPSVLTQNPHSLQWRFQNNTTRVLELKLTFPYSPTIALTCQTPHGSREKKGMVSLFIHPLMFIEPQPL